MSSTCLYTLADLIAYQIACLEQNHGEVNEEGTARHHNIPRLCSAGFVDSGQGYGSLAELPEVPGTGMNVLQNSQKFRVRV